MTKWVQLALNAIAVFTVLYFLTLERNGVFAQHYEYLGVTTVLLMFLVYHARGVYRRFTTEVSGVLKITKAWLIVLGLLVTLAFITKTSELYSRQVLVFWAVGGLLVQYAVYFGVFYLSRLFQRRLNVNIRTLIVGTGSLGEHLVKNIHGNAFLPETVIGVVEAGKGPDKDWRLDDIPLLGTQDKLLDIVHNEGIERVYLALPLNQTAEVTRIQNQLENENLDVIWAPDIFSLNLLNHSVREVAGVPLISLTESPLVVGGQAYMKAVMDTVFALLILVLASPIMVITALAIKFTSPGPVLYKQRRHGWDGTVFNVWKFRSMYLHREEGDTVRQATQGDQRVTPVGQFVRRTSIDELPQLFNVLNGTMSLVGPRPHAIQHNDYYAKQIKTYLARHRIKPGITGLAQINGCRGETGTLDKMQKRVEFDLHYVNNWSLKKDFEILLKTPFSLFGKHVY